jgi:hypothetical protein
MTLHKDSTWAQLWYRSYFTGGVWQPPLEVRLFGTFTHYAGAGAVDTLLVNIYPDPPGTFIGAAVRDHDRLELYGRWRYKRDP